MIQLVYDTSYRSIEALSMDNNYMKNDHEEDALELANTLSNYTSLNLLHFQGECIGSNEMILPAIVSTIFQNLSSLSLCSSNLGIQDIQLISDCLATNPPLKYLDLDNTTLEDDEALLMSDSLQTNTNLIILQLGGSLTETGIRIMIKSIYDDASLNSLYDSNATCELRLWKEDTVSSGVDEIVGMNSHISSIRDAPESVTKKCRKAYESHANCNMGAIETVKLCRMDSRRRVKI